MDELTAFLTARLGEDETAAKALAAAFDGAEWMISGEDFDYTVTAGMLATEAIADMWREDAAAHIACHDPARVLRDVAAKRAILAEHRRGAVLDFTCRTCINQDVSDMDSGDQYIDWPCPTLRLLAAVWSDHPDYRAEWARRAGYQW